MARSHKVFVNLPVRDLEKTMAFFTALGFTFNKQFTDANAACMVLSDDGYVMLLVEPFFKTFTRRELSDSTKTTEALIALSCDSRAEVDAMADQALASGGTEAMPPQVHGDFMYSRSFYDIDGHHWEVLWMDPKVIQQG